MLAYEAGEDFRQPGLNEILGGAKAQPAAQRPSGEMAHRPLVGFENGAGEGHHRLAFRRHRDRMRVADEQPVADRLFELADMLADRRLAKAEAPARLGEARAFGDDEKGPQADRIEHQAIGKSHRTYRNRPRSAAEHNLHNRRAAV